MHPQSGNHDRGGWEGKYMKNSEIQRESNHTNAKSSFVIQKLNIDEHQTNRMHTTGTFPKATCVFTIAKSYIDETKTSRAYTTATLQKQA